jgi:hypothetical protein
MQKDTHFYLTYALARRVGIEPDEALKIAWANQYTDDCKKPRLHGLRTQCGLLADWYDRTVQHDVIVAFHFVPGDKGWLVTANNKRARRLVQQANNPFELGIALHALQDTFSHAGFTGWAEPANARPWLRWLPNPTPNVGHADLGKIPDIIYIKLITGQVIDNREKALACAQATYELLGGKYWSKVRNEVLNAFVINYDKRKEALKVLAGRKLRYSQLKMSEYKRPFILAARKHLSRLLSSL